MSVGINIQSDEIDNLVTAVETLGGGISGDDIKRNVGLAMQQVIFDHFARLSSDSEHHQTADSLGANRTGFYEKAARGVQQPQLESDGVSVSIEMEGLAQRLFGGTIEARPGSFLTIPARAETYGHRAREFSNLMLIIFPSGLGALVAPTDTPMKRGRGKRGFGSERPSFTRTFDEGGVYYWLVKQVTQQPDPTVLPTDDEMLEPALLNAQRFIERIWNEGAAA
jgi:hypothetical protein